MPKQHHSGARLGDRTEEKSRAAQPGFRRASPALPTAGQSSTAAIADPCAHPAGGTAGKPAETAQPDARGRCGTGRGWRGGGGARSQGRLRAVPPHPTPAPPPARRAARPRGRWRRERGASAGARARAAVLAPAGARLRGRAGAVGWAGLRLSLRNCPRAGCGPPGMQAVARLGRQGPERRGGRPRTVTGRAGCGR